MGPSPTAQWVKKSTCSAEDTGDVGSIPGLGRSPEGGKWPHTPVLLPGEPHGQRSLAGCRRVGHDWAAERTQQQGMHLQFCPSEAGTAPGRDGSRQGHLQAGTAPGRDGSRQGQRPRCLEAGQNRKLQLLLKQTPDQPLSSAPSFPPSQVPSAVTS